MSRTNQNRAALVVLSWIGVLALPAIITLMSVKVPGTLNIPSQDPDTPRLYLEPEPLHHPHGGSGRLVSSPSAVASPT